jgi:hypothetical protein
MGIRDPGLCAVRPGVVAVLLRTSGLEHIGVHRAPIRRSLRPSTGRKEVNGTIGRARRASSLNGTSYFCRGVASMTKVAPAHVATMRADMEKAARPRCALHGPSHCRGRSQRNAAAVRRASAPGGSGSVGRRSVLRAR